MTTYDTSDAAIPESPASRVVRPSVPLSDPVQGVPWIVAIFVGASASYALLHQLLQGVGFGPAPLLSIGTALIGAAILAAVGLAEFGPLRDWTATKTRGAVVMAISAAAAFGFWALFSDYLGYDLATWSFPVIGTLWFFIAATSFIGEDALLGGLAPGRRTLLNAVIWIAGTVIVLATIVWIPPFWFGAIQTLLVTGGFAYLLRGVAQPAKSIYSWALLGLLTAIVIVVSEKLGAWDFGANVGPWAIGGPTAEWGVFFGLWCGLNFGALTALQCWPFSRLRRPWGPLLALPSVIAWSAGLTVVAVAVFDALFSDHAEALMEAQAWAWHTVFWSFGFALVCGAGAGEYRWMGEEDEQ